MSTYCIISTFYLPNFSGVEKYTANLAHALVASGQKAIVVTSALEDNPGIAEEDGVTVVRVPSHLLLNKRFAAPKKGAKLDGLMKWLREQPIDRILVNQRFYPTSIFGLKFAKSQGLPAITLDHGSAHLTMANPFLDFFIQSYEHLITAIDKRHCSHYCGVSEKSVEWLEHFGIQNASILYNAIDADDFVMSSSNRGFRSELGLPDDAFTVVFTGRLMEEKGIMRACAAVERLATKGHDNTHLLIAGDGPKAKEIAELGSKNIHLLGRLSMEDISALLAQSDVFCLPTVSEGFSTSMLEAAAHGLGIIVTDTGGARELMPTDDYGQVIPDVSTDTIQQAILRFCNNRDYLHQCGANVGHRVRELFSWEQTAKTLMATFDKMALPADNDR